MQPESDKWGWKHVSVFGGFDKGSGTKRWKCNHCNLRYNGSYSRVRAHLLGFTGVGVKSCPAIDSPLREAFHVLEEERAARKRKRITGGPENPGKRARAPSQPSVGAGVAKEDVDDVVARFVYVNGLSFDVVESPYFREMIKAVASYGSRYRFPTADDLRGLFLTREKARIEKSMAILRESWPKAGCSVLCVGRSETQVHIFVSSPRGLVFLRAFDSGNGGKGTGDRLASVLIDVISEIGPTSVLQVITHLNDGKIKLPDYLVSEKFPRVFVSRCTSQSVRALLEEIAETDWMKPVVARAKEIERCVSKFQGFSPGAFPHNLKENSDAVASKYVPFFCTVRRVHELKQELGDMVVGDEWKRWKGSTQQQEVKDVVADIEAAIVEDSFWSDADSLMQLIEPFVKSLGSLDTERMGEVCDWRVRALEEARKNEGEKNDRLDGLEELIEKRWDALFSPLHAASYLLNPRHFGKGQKDKVVMRGWKSAVERYEGESVNRRALREQLSSYWRSTGDEDAVDCRDKMEGVAWWENFGFETPDLQTLAVNVLSQVSSCTEMCPDNCGSSGPETLGLHAAQDLAFVQNNLRIHSHKVGPSSGSKTANHVLLLE